MLAVILCHYQIRYWLFLNDIEDVKILLVNALIY